LSVQPAPTRRVKAAGDHWIVEDFHAAVVSFLALPWHADFAHPFARAVADHATPVGGGTVARTKRISVEQRAGAAVISRCLTAILLLPLCDFKFSPGRKPV